MTVGPSTVPSAQPDPALVERVRWRLARAGDPPTPDRVAAALRSEGGVRGDVEVLSVVTALGSELSGAGPLAPLLREPGVTDVLVNGPDAVWVDRGRGLQRASDVRFPDAAAVERLARRLAGLAGRRLDAAAPYVDGRLPGGVRLHAVLPPVSPDGACISLRVPPARAFTIDELRAAGTLTHDVELVLRALVEARLAFLVTGGTGAGKTTLLSSVLGLMPTDERLLLVEDSAELRPEHPHVVRLEARPPNVEGAGVVTLRDLVRQSLRMRPDRLVVGEVRGAEVVDLLAALNTGHEGGCGTLHANRPGDVPARLEALAAMAGATRAAVHSQIAAALDVVVHIVRERAVRRVAAVGVFVADESGRVAVHPALVTTAAGNSAPGEAAGLLTRRLRAGGVAAADLGLLAACTQGPREMRLAAGGQ